MTHGVNDNVHADLVSHETELRGITWIVDPLPGVAQIAVACEKNHQPPVLVFDAHVMRSDAAMLVSHTANQCGNARDLDHMVHIEIAVKDRVRVRKTISRPSLFSTPM